MSCVLCHKEDCPDDVGVAEHVVPPPVDPYHKTAKKLLQHNATMVGALRSNKKMPRELMYDARKLLFIPLDFCLVEMMA